MLPQLFGCDRVNPYASLDSAGLLWLLNGGKLVALTAVTATIETTGGARQTYRRCPIEVDAVAPAWELAVPSNPTTAAARMRRHRKRRRDGLRCLTVELRETEIDMLVCRALLKPEMRHSKSPIINALHEHLDQTLSVPR